MTLSTRRLRVTTGRWLAAALLLSAPVVLAAHEPGAAAERPLQPDIHFLSETGEIVRGTRCATPKPTPTQIQQAAEAFERWQRSGAPGIVHETDVVIPVAWHVVHRGRAGNVPDSMIDAQIQVLNDAFAGTGFSFELVHVDRTRKRGWFLRCDRPRVERRMKRALAIDPATTLNVYSCRPPGLLGYAYFPNSFPEDDIRHGIVVRDTSLPGGGAAPYDEGDTATHEIGHYLGLYHTFEGGCDGDGDFVADTPAEAFPAFGCPIDRDTCSSAGVDPIFNYMNYTDDACMSEFTPDQVIRMHALTSTFRPTLYF